MVEKKKLKVLIQLVSYFSSRDLISASNNRVLRIISIPYDRGSSTSSVPHNRGILDYIFSSRNLTLVSNNQAKVYQIARSPRAEQVLQFQLPVTNQIVDPSCLHYLEGIKVGCNLQRDESFKPKPTMKMCQNEQLLYTNILNRIIYSVACGSMRITSSHKEIS
ncbi:hypothetical protein LguiB_007352 [Lonicera macranthoides]